MSHVGSRYVCSEQRSTRTRSARSRRRSPLAIGVSIAGLLTTAAGAQINFETGPNWVSLGPAPIVDGAPLNNLSILSPPMSGRATVLAVNPMNRYNVWLGTAGGGVWVTNNENIGDVTDSNFKPDTGNFDSNWQPHWFAHNGGAGGLASLSIGAILLDESTCSESGCGTAYVGTGENSLRRDTYYGEGVYQVAFDDSGEFDLWRFSRLDTAEQFTHGSTAAMVLDDGELFVALSAGNTTTAVYASVRAPEPAAGYGVHRRETDGTWSRIFETTSNGQEAWADQLLPTDLIKDPGGSDSFLLGVHNDGIFRTTDRGQTWCALTPNSRLRTASQNGTIATDISDCSSGTNLPAAGTFDFVDLAAESADVLYAMFGNCPSGFTEETQRATSLCSDGLWPNDTPRNPELFKSTDGGASWFEPGQVQGPHYSRYTHGLVAAGGGQILWSSLSPHLIGTDPFSQSSLRRGSLHYDVHDLAAWAGWDAGDPVFFAATDGGFYFRGDSNWVAGNDSLITAAFVGLAIDYEDEPGDEFPRTLGMLGGLQDNSNVVFNGSPVWQLWGPIGDGGEALIQTATITYDSIQNNDIRRIPGYNSWSRGIDGPLVNNEEDASFYSPLTQHEATKRVFIATDVVSVREGSVAAWDSDAGAPFPSATTISQVLGTDTNAFHPVETDRDLITALAVAPSHQWRVYAGLYSGRLWRSTTSASDRPEPGDWVRIDSGLRSGTISSIEVHPTDHRQLWVTFSDFSPDVVWYSGDEGGSWEARSSGLPPGEPANVIKVRRNAPSELWLGTDTGVYLSTDGGLSWEARKANLPRVPVFDLEIDQYTNRIFAATHGRGVWMLTEEGPVLTTYEGWTESGIWDIPIYGVGFDCARADGCDCTVDIEREDNSVCASGNIDGLGNRIFIADGGHTLRTENQGSCTRCDGKPVAFACFNRDCVGGVDLADCNQDGHRVSAVRVRCEDNPEASGSVAGTCPEQSNPPSNLFDVTPALTLPGTTAPGDALPPAPVVLAPTVMASPPSGGDRRLCTALADLNAEERQLGIRDAINESPSCQAAGVRASVVETVVMSGEDRPEEPDLRVGLSAPGVRGAQLVLAVAAGPGSATDFCFDASRLGAYLANQVAISQVGFPTRPGGALGGEIVVEEISPVGYCSMRVPTTAGQSSEQIAQAIAAAFQEPGVPAPRTCPESNNPRDIIQEGGTIVAVLPTTLRVCIHDAGVGFTFDPHGVAGVPPQIQVPGDLAFDDTCLDEESFETLNVCNTGKGDLIVDPIVSSDPQFAVTEPTAGYPVIVSPDFCFPFQAVFTPTSTGPQSAILSIPSNDPVNPVTVIEATGEGTVQEIQVTGSGDFGVGSAWSPNEESLTVCNRGHCKLTVISAAIDCADFELVDDPLPTDLWADSCLDLAVRFTPQTPGRKECTLTIESDDPDRPTITSRLRGRTPPALGLRAGLAQARGPLSTVARQGSRLELLFVNRVTPKLGWDVRLGVAQFDGRPPATDTSVDTLAASVRYTLNPASFARFFLAGGPGLYHFDPGDFEGGIHGGVGLQVPAGRRFTFEAAFNYHLPFTAQPDAEFTELLAGFLVSF